VVVRDLDRHPWQQAAATAIVGRDDRGVIVDVGYPAGDAFNGTARITTFGAGRASLTAAAELLLGAR
jgi:hypothetical protein